MIDAKDAENAVLRGELQAQLERYRRLELRVAALERRLGSDSTTSGTPPSKDPIGARERRTAERKATVTASPSREPTMVPGGSRKGAATTVVTIDRRREMLSISQLLPHVSGRDAHQLPALRGATLRYVDVLDTGIG